MDKDNCVVCGCPPSWKDKNGKNRSIMMHGVYGVHYCKNCPGKFKKAISMCKTSLFSEDKTLRADIDNARKKYIKPRLDKLFAHNEEVRQEVIKQVNKIKTSL